jgi:hypothetical protein
MTTMSAMPARLEGWFRDVRPGIDRILFWPNGAGGGPPPLTLEGRKVLL